jgi:hypothetical protein
MSKLRIMQKAHPNVRVKQSATHALTSKTHQTAPGTPHDNATLYEDRKAHQARSRQRNQKTLPRQKLTTPYTTTASHAIAAYVSSIVVSSITEAVILSYLYRDRLLFTHRETYAEMLGMPQPVYAKKLQAARVHLSHTEKLLHATTSIC